MGAVGGDWMGSGGRCHGGWGTPSCWLKVERRGRLKKEKEESLLSSCSVPHKSINCEWKVWVGLVGEFVGGSWWVKGLVKFLSVKILLWLARVICLTVVWWVEWSAHFEKEWGYVSFLNTSGGVTDICPSNKCHSRMHPRNTDYSVPGWTFDCLGFI